MSGGGLGDKLGNWYEHDHVVLLYLRLLDGQVTSVSWEPENNDEEAGVDARYVNPSGLTVAAQYKKRDTENWSLAPLAEILLNAARQLIDPLTDGGRRPDEFHLVSTTSSVPWNIANKALLETSGRGKADRKWTNLLDACANCKTSRRLPGTPLTEDELRRRACRPGEHS